MPVAEGLLVAPALLPVVSQGAWAAGVGSSLRKLGCRLLAATALPGSMAEVECPTRSTGFQDFGIAMMSCLDCIDVIRLQQRTVPPM